MKYLAAFFAGMLTMFAILVRRVNLTKCAECGEPFEYHRIGCSAAPWSKGAK